jgi:hypothetical protein
MDEKGKPTEDGIDYQALVTDALLDVPRRVLRQVAESGLPGEHHFLISFRTAHPGVELPARLGRQYPEEMTIVLQHQFWGLDVEEDGFAVMLRFGAARERLHVPFAALTGFVDPQAQFGLKFEHARATSAGDASPTEPGARPAAPKADGTAPPGATVEGSNKVVDLGAFRKRD